MLTPNTHRLKLVARALRLIAGALENVRDVRDLRRILLSLSSAICIINLSIFSVQKTLILNAKHDLDGRESSHVS